MSADGEQGGVIQADRDAAAEVVRLRTILCDLERSATAVYRNGAVTGPQWSLLGGALIRTRAALAKHPTSPEAAA